jgi:hypothetical protein
MNHVLAAALFALAAAVAPLSPAAAQDRANKIDLRPKFQPGQETRFKMETSIDSRATGADEAMKQELSATLKLKARETSPDTGSVLELVYESLKLSLKSPYGDINFDSTQPAGGGDPLAQSLASVVGTTLVIKMDQSGNIQEVTGGPGGPAGQFTGRDIIQNMFGPIFTSKRGTGLAAVGETWTNEDTMDGGHGTVRITTTNTLKSHSGDRAVIDIRGTYSMDKSSAAEGVTIKPGSEMTGQADWDTRAGMLDKLTLTHQLTTEQKDASGQTLERAVTMDMKVNRVK